MQQLKLFPEVDMIRFALSLTSHELSRLKESRPDDYPRIAHIRNLVHKHDAMVRHMEKRLAFDLNRFLD